MNTFHRLARLCLVLAVTAALTVAFASYAEVLNVISDIHYDPRYGTSTGYKCTTAAAAALGEKACDSPLALMESVFADMSTRGNAYTLYSGDWQRHKFADSGLKANELWPAEANGFASVQTSGTLDTANQVSMVGTLGNNDVVPDYAFEWNAANQPDLEERVELLFSSSILTSAEATQMRHCGYYSRNVSSTLRVVSLHSLLWATSLTTPMPDSVEDPCGQFAFLEAELAAAKGASQKVIIVTHFPTTINFYDVIAHGAFTTAEKDMYWKPRFQERYYKLLAQYADTVKMQLFGHAHLFTPVAHTASGVPAVIVPSISPIFGNVPSYLEMSFANDWTVEHMRQRYLVNSAWTGGMEATGALGLAYGYGDVAKLHTYVTNLLTNDDAWDNYLYMHGGGEKRMDTFPNSQCATFCRAVSVCSMANAYYDDIKACVSNVTSAATTVIDPQVGGSIVTSVLILGVSLAVCLIFGFSKLIPKIRSGELSCDKIHFDWRAQLLGATPQAEQKRRKDQKEGIDRHNAAVAETAANEAATAASAAVEVRDIHYADLDDGPAHHGARE